MFPALIVAIAVLVMSLISAVFILAAALINVLSTLWRNLGVIFVFIFAAALYSVYSTQQATIWTDIDHSLRCARAHLCTCILLTSSPPDAACTPSGPKTSGPFWPCSTTCLKSTGVGSTHTSTYPSK